MRDTEITVWTIGHSTHSYEHFLRLLRGTNITAIADVRTSPYSRHLPQFNRDSLRDELRADGIAYSFLGEELGGRPNDRQFYCDGVADYEKMAQAASFKEGLNRVIEGARRYRIALMCSEREPLECHRCLLVGRALAEKGISVRHIKSDGRVADHKHIEEQLLKLEGQQGDDLFVSREERLATAYQKRSRKVAYSEIPSNSTSHMAAE